MTRRTPSQYNWDKCEFDETILPPSPARSSARTEKIQFVVVHHMTIKGDGSGSALTAASNTWKTREASAHYGVDGDLVRQYVWDNRAAWATADHHGNHAGLSIEHANSALGPKWTVADTTWKTGAKLTAHLHSIYKLGRPVSGKTLRRHHDFYATACPGPYVDSIWSKYVAEAQRVYDEITAKPKPPTPTEPEPPVSKTVTLHGLHWNIAGSDVHNGYGARNATRGPDVGRRAKEIGFEVFLACEASQSNLRHGAESVIGKSWSHGAKAIWKTTNIKLLGPGRKLYADNLWNYLKTVKYGAGIFATKDGVKFSILEIHTDYRKGAKQAKQVASIFAKFRKDSDALGIKHVNQLVVGDFNWDGTSGDDPFKALASYNFVEKGSHTAKTFFTGKHLDGVLAHEEAEVTVKVRDRVDLSDHYPLEFTAKLK